MRSPFFFLCLFFLPLLAGAQRDSSAIPLANFAAGSKLIITEPVSCYIDPLPRARGAAKQDITTVKYKRFDVPWSRVVDQLDRKPRPFAYWIQAGLRNDGDSVLDLSLGYGELDFVDVWFDAGGGNALQYIAAGYLRPTPPGSSYLQRQSRTIALRLSPHSGGRLFVRVRQLTDEYSFTGLELYDPAALNAGFARTLAEDNSSLIIQMLFQGFLACALLYVLFQWLIIRRKEYLYYLLYMSLIALYFLSRQESLFGVDLLFSRWPLLKVYFGKTLLILPYYVYLRFVRSFLEIPRDYPVLNRWVRFTERFLLAYAGFDLLFMFFTFNRGIQTTIYTVVFIAVFLLTVGFMIYLYRHREPLIYFIISGSLLVATGHISGLIFSYLIYSRHLDLGIPDIFVFPQAGIILEILFFTAGLSYKSRRTEQEKITGQEKLIEQLKANELLQNRMQHIRNKIAQDLHDDIGSTLSSISILSDLAMRGSSSSQTMETMNEIKDSSMLLMERMDDIVWSINPRNDSLDTLLMRVRHFATTLFEAKGIDYTIDIQKNLSEVRLPMDYRQHIYLILKEAINNLVKYAEATEAFIDVHFDDHSLHLGVRDNGRGFVVGEPGGNGISGMYRRAGLMNAKVVITSTPGEGTAIRLEVDVEHRP